MSIEADLQFEEATIANVEPCAGGWSVTDVEGWGLFVTSAECSIAPQPNEVIRKYGEGIGRPVRGVSIGGRIYRYLTEEAERAHHAETVAQARHSKAEGYEAKRADHDARVAALPEPLRERVERFRRFRGDEWRHEFEPYEVFVCEQASAFAEALKTAPELEAFYKLPYAEQRQRVPAMTDGHSGNTFGSAVMLARVLIECPERAAQAHGALCPLVGCAHYGCWAAEVAP